MATEGTAKTLKEHGISVQTVKKISEGIPNILDIIRSGVIDLVIDIPQKSNDVGSDSFKIRRGAVESSVSMITSIDTAEAMAEVIAAEINEDKLKLFDIGKDLNK